MSRLPIRQEGNVVEGAKSNGDTKESEKGRERLEEEFGQVGRFGSLSFSLFLSISRNVVVSDRIGRGSRRGSEVGQLPGAEEARWKGESFLCSRRAPCPVRSKCRNF
ncbi:hypothetical protein MA16_Dca028949 [Dendrobium catenatum]|uniref:Uncharacterized protein n=1 Tax=Dendrobium catenatum TaxID=906689 RepID=A0A2I0VGS3_9ASPA|nr:hypothetical protein MA16_Dca028949 [Dendrobium catenatum]